MAVRQRLTRIDTVRFWLLMAESFLRFVAHNAVIVAFVWRVMDGPWDLTTLLVGAVCLTLASSDPLLRAKELLADAKATGRLVEYER